MKTLQLKDYVRASEEFDLEIPAIKAVAKVESGGRNGFYVKGVNAGKPKILFEGHIFWSQLKRKGINPEDYLKDNEDILQNKFIPGNPLYRMDQYYRLHKAEKIDQEAANKSASWGKFQIMGFNHVVCGFDNVMDFRKAQEESEYEHLKAFFNFIQKRIIKGKSLLEYLKEKNWDMFAYGYNGAGYKKHGYDKKLRNAYEGYHSS